MNKETKLHFRTRARLLYQLGEQLIKNESIALLELVKNAYDADADYCEVFIKKPESLEEGEIIIIDHNGEGMNRYILENIWLEVGTDDKAEKKKYNYHTPRYNRIPLGEKGIGRFGVHRLGRRIEVVTRRIEEQKECVLRIDWDKINNSKYIEDIPIVLEEREPVIFKKETGTKIIITKLRKTWTRGTIRDIARAINSLNSPFESNGTFKVSFLTDNDWLDGLLSYEDIKEKNLYSFEVKLSGNSIVDFSYDFIPYKNLNKVQENHISFKDIEKISRMIKKGDDGKEKEINLSKFRIGDIKIKGIIFDLDTKILNLGLATGIKELKDYLRQNGGIKVFRDNMRIWDYGEVDNDWLELDAERINRPSFKLSNRLTLAAVYLNSRDSQDLIEKTNREGFVDNEAFKEFKDACRYAIDKVEFFRNLDKEKLRLMYNSSSAREIPVIDSIEEIKEIVKKEISNMPLKEKINKRLDRISKDFTSITDNLIKSAGTGLNLISVLHQIEKIVKSLKINIKNVENPTTLEQVEKSIENLVNLVSGYSVLARNSIIKKQNIITILDSAIKNLELRFKMHKINVVSDFNSQSPLEAFSSESYLLNAVMNLFDNSIWWLDYAKTENPQIYITITDALEGYYTIIIADNGPGFVISKEELTLPFVSAKPAGLGMGIGLHLTKIIMENLKGKLLFPEAEDFSLPNKYKNGAIVALAFRRK